MKKKKNRYDQILEAAKIVLRGLERFSGDLERVVENEGLKLEVVDHLSHGVAAIHGDLIAVTKDESPIIVRLRILHELGHHYLHSMCIGYYQTDKIRVIKEEKEAQTFATLVLYPSIDDFETEKDFIMRSGLPEQTSKLRIAFFRRTGI